MPCDEVVDWRQEARALWEDGRLDAAEMTDQERKGYVKASRTAGLAGHYRADGAEGKPFRYIGI